MSQEYVIQVLQEVKALAGADSGANMDSIFRRVTDAYKIAESKQDEKSMVLLTDAYARLQQLETAMGGAVEIAATARALVETVEAQREATATALEQKRAAMREFDTNDPDVLASVGEARYAIVNDIYDEGGLITYDVAVEICGQAGIPVEEWQAQEFFMILTSDALSEGFEDDIAQPFREELAEFIREFVHRVQLARDEAS